MTRSTRENEPLPVWDLSDLYAGADDPGLDRDMREAARRARQFEEKYKGTISAAGLPAAHLRQALADYEDLLTLRSRPGAYAGLLYSTDTADPARGALLQKTREFDSSTATHLVFFDLEIGRIPPQTYERIKDSPELAPYRHYLDHERRMAAHNLDEAEEKILVETANSRGKAFARLATEVNSRTRFLMEEEGGAVEKSQSEILVLLYDPDRDTRRRAAAAITEGLRRNTHVCTFVYNTLLHEKDVLDRLRSYRAPEDSRHLDNELSGEVVDAVSEVCAANYGTVAAYYRLKRRLLGLDELTHYDRYAPITGGETDIPFGQARDIVLEAFGEFSPRLVDICEPFFERRWIDAALADGKRGGAYCAGITPDLHPYVFLNYTGSPRDVMTLAHELGHGIHDVLASRNHLLDYHPVLPMAETASTFAEMLVFDRLRGELDSDRERLALLCGKIEDTFATVFRQIAMYRFEQQAHRARREEGELPSERLDELWQRNMQEMFGDALTLGDDHACWWLYIPHIVDVPFYVYAYAFGELLVLALYARYRSEGEAFVGRYFELLAAGGSRAPAELLAGLEIDVASRDFWQGGCDLIRQRVDEAAALAG
ncbi:MAG: M3 family oligoendopeptidase [Gemmatimonadetes bacterium]|nr:M3 family oligoendopeptidase [Gemmatimonadota bacterium]